MAEEKSKADLLKDFHFSEEKAELVSGVVEPTGFPSPDFFYRLNVEAINLPIEEAYFWTIDELKYGFSHNKFVKISDISAAAEQSAFFGVSEQRLGAQQDKAAQYLRGISEMLKALFQIVREIRIMDERIGYYEHTFNRDPKKSDEESSGSEITLKGIWVDQVEGGVKNAASVYGLSQTVGFTVLPDLFFRIRADDIGLHKLSATNFDAATKKIVANVDLSIKKIEGFNDKVKEVLARKLVQYYMWKVRTYRELKTRRNFTIKYLRQHYDTIKLYTGWVKPYLRNIKRLQMADKLVKNDTADLITAFEGALVEIEVLSYKDVGKFKPCVLIHLYYRTRPALSYVQEGYQRGPMHTGMFDMVLRGYVWNSDQIKNYLNMREHEDMDLMSSIDQSIKESMDNLGQELKDYLIEAKEIFPEDDKPKPDEDKEATMLKALSDPFTNIFGGLKEVFGPLASGIPRPKRGKAPPSKDDDVKDVNEKGRVQAELRRTIYTTYKNYKKMHGMMTW